MNETRYMIVGGAPSVIRNSNALELEESDILSDDGNRRAWATNETWFEIRELQKR